MKFSMGVFHQTRGKQMNFDINLQVSLAVMSKMQIETPDRRVQLISWQRGARLMCALIMEPVISDTPP